MIGAVIAMQSEAQILIDCMQVKKQEQLGNKTIYTGTAFEKDVVLIVCGVGKVNAAMGAQILLDRYNVDCLLNFGVAGGLNAYTELCSVYQIGSAVQFDFDLTQLNNTKIGTLDEYTENYLPVSLLDVNVPVRALGTSDRFNDSLDDYALLTQELQADIRDMEGAAIVQVAIAMNVPVYSVKAISDVAGNGSTTEQFLVNRAKALENLKAALPYFFEKL